MPVSPPGAMGKAGKAGAARATVDGLPSVGSLKASVGFSPQFKEQLQELQAWDMPVNSLAVLAAGTAAYYMTKFQGYSMVNLVCYVLMFRLLVVAAGRKAVAAASSREALATPRAWAEKGIVLIESTLFIPSPSHVSNVVGGSASLLEAKVNKVCQALSEATDPTNGFGKLKVVMAHLIVVVVVFRFFSLWTLLYLSFAYAMVWPALYKRHQDKIDDMAANAWDKAQPHMEAAKEKGKAALAFLEAKAKAGVDAAAAKAKNVASKARLPAKSTDAAADAKSD